ncbi:alkaline phosphatase D family protein [Qipengyuania atrilutea]|uniref:Alkaline phosphatase D family protein n=1 Tax=Qipengyuania atrilutea TaxID=2744473 RepID=A0A850H534_9SPHN|nr:alkaline phosphatase D family protein [Actirhodobacter atriluteus]NVD44998.1 alkaline phosphatase D family protein [Actirhodobacter atriluteus]
MQSAKINRRGVLGLFGSSGAAALPGCTTIPEANAAVRFAHGVASGDPAPDGALLWTRASVEEAGAGDVPLRWFVVSGAAGSPTASGTALARTAADHTVKVEVDGLEPGREYRYYFTGPDGTRSPEGRFRTLPVGATDNVVLAVASCQLYPGGYFNAYAHMAQSERLDAVLMLGDYIYEYGADGYGADIGQRLNRLPDPLHETVTLEDYRRRHAQVKSDPDMQAAHARAAFICVWDDHEVTNDGWIGGAENHQPESEGDWEQRKAAAMQAYFEWMPIRDPKPGRAASEIYRSFEFGDLLTLAMLETRLLVRDKQLEFAGDPSDANAYARLLTALSDEKRELIGSRQRDWLRETLRTSTEAGKPWQIVANQVVMAKVSGPQLRRQMGEARYAQMLAQLPSGYEGRLRDAQLAYEAGVPFNLDAWDGYPGARKRLYEAFGASASKPIVLAGDSHAGWANNLFDDAGELVALELGCTAITSPSYGSLLPGIGRYIEAANEEVAYCNQDKKGYTLLTLTPAEAKADFITVDTVLDRKFDAEVDASFVALAGDEFANWRRAGEA